MGDKTEKLIKVRSLKVPSCSRELFRSLLELILFVCVLACAIVCVSVFASVHNSINDISLQDGCILFIDSVLVLADDGICLTVIWGEACIAIVAGLFVALLVLKAIFVWRK